MLLQGQGVCDEACDNVCDEACDNACDERRQIDSPTCVEAFAGGPCVVTAFGPR
ncbi:unnamed protein product, partial [Closterium sp. NIES-65]